MDSRKESLGYCTSLLDDLDAFSINTINQRSHMTATHPLEFTMVSNKGVIGFVYF